MQRSNLMVNIILLKQSPLKLYMKPYLHAEQPLLSKPFLTGKVSHPDHFFVSSLNLLQQVHIIPVLGTPELHAVLQVWCHQHGVKG